MNKGLEALREIESISERIAFNGKHKLGKVDYQWIKEIIYKNTQAIEKSLKALEIIKEKLDVNEILFAIKGVGNAHEYDLLKEVLE